MNFFSLLEERTKQKNCLICVGLDPHKSELESHTAEAAFKFCTQIIDETKHIAACYKPNIAFFEAIDGGIQILKILISCIPKNIPIILDAKRGDISTTAEAYADAAKKLGANCITLSGYMGSDTIHPFLKENFNVFVLCKTSNGSSDEFQCLIVNPEGRKPCFLYEEVAYRMQQLDPTGEKIGLVVGATDVQSIKNVRIAAPKLWILCPGVGAQSGDLESSLEAGLREDRSGILINLSRGISRAKDIKKAIDEYQEKMERIINNRKIVHLKQYQLEFIEFCMKYNVLKFGRFELKSKRISPFFFNAGSFSDGEAAKLLAHFYYEALNHNPIEYDVIFGPAYKGITLSALLAYELATKGRNVPYVYNRKEVKDHGEQELLVGQSIEGKRVLVIDDVMTAGTAVTESAEIIKKYGGTLVGVVISLDRQERTDSGSGLSAVQEAKKKFNIEVISIISFQHLIRYLEICKGQEDILKLIKEYRMQYGVNID